MAVIHFERTSADGNRKTQGSTVRGWPKRIGAALMLPVVLGLIIFKPAWFEQDE